MRIKLVCVGHLKEAYLRDAVDEYLQRLRRYATVDYREIKAEKRSGSANDADVKQREAAKIAQVVTPQEFIVALDETGQQYSSVEFAHFLSRSRMRGDIKTLTFVTGGATGFPGEFLRDADGVVSLSKMTLPHQFCRLILLEQLYRAHTIIAGEPYHKA